MSKIILHIPTGSLDDKEGIKVEYEASDILNIRSITGNDDEGMAKFNVKGINETLSCLESANTLRRMVNENSESPKPTFSVGTYVSGNQTNNNLINQKGIVLWCKDIKFISGFVTGIVASFLASWLFTIIF